MLQKKALKIKGYSQANEIFHPAQEAYSLLDPDTVGVNKIKPEFPWLIFLDQDVSIGKITMENPLFMAGRKMLAQGDKKLAKPRRRKFREEEANLFDSSYSLCQKKALVQEKPFSFHQVSDRRRRLYPSLNQSYSATPGFKGLSAQKEAFQPVHSPGTKLFNNNVYFAFILLGQSDNAHSIPPVKKNFCILVAQKTAAIRNRLDKKRMIVGCFYSPLERR
jgi:hypothetical protein